MKSARIVSGLALAAALSIVPVLPALAQAESAPPARPSTNLGLSPEAIGRLSPEQITELARADLQQQVAADGPVVAVVVPTAFFAMILGIVALALVHRSRRDRLLHETLRAMVDKGAAIPHELLVPPAKRTSDVRRGTLLLAAGVGLAACLLIVVPEGQERAAGLGLVPALLGVGYLVANRLDRRDTEDRSV